MKAAKLEAGKTAEVKRENTASSKQAVKQENGQTTLSGETGEKRKLPWELLFLFVVMGLTMVVIALKAFSVL